MKRRVVRQGSVTRVAPKEPIVDRIVEIPATKTGRRIWSKVDNETLVTYAGQTIEKKGIKGRKELQKKDSGLYSALNNRRLTDEVFIDIEAQKEARVDQKPIEELLEAAEKLGVEKAVGPTITKTGKRRWREIDDVELILYTRKVMWKNKITGKYELRKKDRALCAELKRRGLVDYVGFIEERRRWSKLSDDELIEHTRKVISSKGIKTKTELYKTDGGLTYVLRRRKLIDKVGFVETKKKGKDWSGMSDEELVAYAKKIMKQHGITEKHELKKIESGLHTTLYNRGLMSKIKFEGKRRNWKDMSDDEIVVYAKRVMADNGITKKSELLEIDNGLYQIMMRRKLLGKIKFEKRLRHRWNGMTDDEIVAYARKIMIDNEITRRWELGKFDGGVYTTLRKRKLLDRVFAEIEAQRKTDSEQRAAEDMLSAAKELGAA